MNKIPRVSIGMPLYNAEAHVTRALDALLRQTFTDFELIISDNASTDGTWAICEAYSRQDSRIRLYRNETNQGVVKNFQRVLDLAQGDYFMWAAYDDAWEPEFIATCVAALDNHPEAVLAFTGITLIREPSGQTSIMELHFEKQSPEVWRRFVDFLNHPDPKNSIIYGLYRRTLLEQVGLVPLGLGADILWLLRCAVVGTFIQLEPVLFTTHIARRPIRSRLRQHTAGAPVNVLTLFRMDWTFIRQLMRLTQSVAPHMRARFHLLRASLYIIRIRLGWPLSLRLFTRYGSLLLPESLLPRLQTRRSKQ